MHCGARQRARSRDMSVYKIVGSMHSSVIYTQDCIRNKPSALSHSDVHLMTHDVQLPAMMCSYTFYTYKINALVRGQGGIKTMKVCAQPGIIDAGGLRLDIQKQLKETSVYLAALALRSKFFSFRSSRSGGRGLYQRLVPARLSRVHKHADTCD